MKPTHAPMLGLMLALYLVGVPNGPAARPGAFVVAQRPAGEVAEGIPVKEREAPPDDPAADQAEADADAAQAPGVEQPGVADPPDVVQPSDEQ